MLRVSASSPRTALAAAVLLLAVLPLQAKPDRQDRSGPDDDVIRDLPSLAEKTAKLERRDGFVTLWLDPERSGRVWLEVPPPTGPRGLALEMIYIEGISTGLGSNPIGLDRGQIGDNVFLEVRRVGNKVLFVQPNLRFRAMTQNPDERRAARESFAPSVLWGGAVVALDPDGRSLVELTPFLVRDAHGVRSTLRGTDQGDFQLDEDSSAVDFAACLAFPDNVELEAILTYRSENPGGHVRATAPNPEAFSLVQHYSFIRPPDSSYKPREFDPRTASLAISFQDYAVPLDAAIDRRFILRHRLEKTDPSAERSAVREPIVYYVDRGAPEPIRGALLEGARWWAEAFKAAGFVNAYRVELLPEGAHPLDVRYNVIQWVHRSTRGWSYGNAVADPRTGEILKGHVSLGSLRVRQDRLLFEGLLGTERTGSGDPEDPIELSLARIRQLSAHEVGHTLGFTHNFAASTYGGRASVMDYPAPLLRAREDGTIDVSQAYGVGIGDWDIHSVRYSYSQFLPDADEAAELEKIVRGGIARGYIFVDDAHARPSGAADPRGSLWDNGTDAVAELENVLRVRELALARFGAHNLPAGRPLAALQEVLAPLYFHHRYQLDAAVKVLGGMEVDTALREDALRGDGPVPLRIISGGRQRQALEVLLGILEPSALDLPEEILLLLPPRPFGFERNREMFSTATSPAFDALGAAATVADDVVEALIQPERFGRLLDFHRRDPSLPSVDEVLGELVETAFSSSEGGGERHAALHRVVQRVVVDRLIHAAAGPHLRGALRAAHEQALRQIFGRLEGGEPASHAATLRGDIHRFLERGIVTPTEIMPPAPAPPGSPIGSAGKGLGACGMDG